MKKIKKLYSKHEEILNYLIVGFLTTFVSLGTYLIFVNALFPDKSDLSIQISNVLSWICAVTFAYFTNRIFVFKSKSQNKEKIKEAIKFYSSRVASLIMDMALMYILYSMLHIDDTISKLIVQVFVTIANYVLAKLLVFKNH